MFSVSGPEGCTQVSQRTIPSVLLKMDVAGKGEADGTRQVSGAYSAR
jgi:hypothetical protein